MSGASGGGGGGGGSGGLSVPVDWAHIIPSTELLAPVVGDNVIFDTLKAGNGGITTNAAGEFTLKAGKTYRVEFGIGASFSAASGSIGAHLYDITNGVEIASRAYSVPPTFATAIMRGPSGYAFAQFTVGASDILCAVRVTSVVSVTKLYFESSGTRLAITEIQQGTGALVVAGSLAGQSLHWDPATSTYLPDSKIMAGGSTATATGTVATDGHTELLDASGAPIIRTLPDAALSDGRILVFKKIDATANTATVAGAGGDLIDGAATAVLTIQYESITLHAIGGAWWVI